MKTKEKVPVPTGWVDTSLATLGRLHCGQSPSSSAVNSEGNGVPYVSGPEHWDGFTLNLDKWTTQPKRLVPDGCIFITVKGAGVGTIFPGVECAIGRDIYAFEPSPGVSARFVELAIRATVNEVVWNARGDIPGLSKSHILNHQILVPGPATQERIAAKIDELFSDIEAGEKALERAALLMKRYRQSVLKAAITGELTKDWRAKNLARIKREKKTGADLLAEILVKRRAAWEAAELAKMIAKGKPPGDDKWKQRYVEPAAPRLVELPQLPDGWAWGTLSQLFDVETGATPKRGVAEFYEGGTVPWITSASVNCHRIAQASEFITPTALIKTNAKVFPAGSLILAMYGEGKTRGKCSELAIDAATNQACAALLTPRISDNLKRFAIIFLEHNYEAMRRLAAGGVQPNLNLEIIRSMAIPIPPDDEQVRIAVEADLRLTECSVAAGSIQAEFKRASALRNTILRQAFAGKLVPQESADEPASALIERIRAERDAPKPPHPNAQAKAKKRGTHRGRPKKGYESRNAQDKVV